MKLKLNIPTVENMRSARGNDIPNQFKIYTPDGVAFQSYSTIIAYKEFTTNKIYLDANKWDYSRTTGKYRNEFLNENIAETRQKIKNGKYILTDLN